MQPIQKESRDIIQYQLRRNPACMWSSVIFMSLDAALCSLFANSPHDGSGMTHLLWETDIKSRPLLRKLQDFMLSNTTWHYNKYWWFDMIWNDVCIWPVIHFSLRAVTWFYCPDVLGVTGNDVTSTCGSLTMRRDVMWPDVRPHGLTWCDIDISLRGGTRQDVTWWFTFKDSKVFHLRTSYSPIHPLSIDRFLPWMSLNVDLWGNIDHVRYKRPEWWWLQTSRIFPQSDLSLH